MTEKRMTTTEFSKFIHHISGYNNNIQNVISMLRTNRAFFIRFCSTELSYVMQNKESTYFNETFIQHVESAVDFILEQYLKTLDLMYFIQNINLVNIYLKPNTIKR